MAGGWPDMPPPERHGIECPAGEKGKKAVNGPVGNCGLADGLRGGLREDVAPGIDDEAGYAAG